MRERLDCPHDAIEFLRAEGYSFDSPQFWLLLVELPEANDETPTCGNVVVTDVYHIDREQDQNNKEGKSQEMYDWFNRTMPDDGIPRAVIAIHNHMCHGRAPNVCAHDIDMTIHLCGIGMAANLPIFEHLITDESGSDAFSMAMTGLIEMCSQQAMSVLGIESYKGPKVLGGAPPKQQTVEEKLTGKHLQAIRQARARQGKPPTELGL